MDAGKLTQARVKSGFELMAKAPNSCCDLSKRSKCCVGAIADAAAQRETSTLRYLGVEFEDALSNAEKIDI